MSHTTYNLSKNGPTARGMPAHTNMHAHKTHQQMDIFYSKAGILLAIWPKLHLSYKWDNNVHFFKYGIAHHKFKWFTHTFSYPLLLSKYTAESTILYNTINTKINEYHCVNHDEVWWQTFNVFRLGKLWLQSCERKNKESKLTVSFSCWFLNPAFPFSPNMFIVSKHEYRFLLKIKSISSEQEDWNITGLADNWKC